MCNAACDLLLESINNFPFNILECFNILFSCKGRLDLPIVSGKHLRRISDRTALQSADNAEKFITTRKIDSFESLANFTADKEQRYQELEMVHLSKGQKLSRLKELSKMYALFAPIQATYKETVTKRTCENEIR